MLYFNILLHKSRPNVPSVIKNVLDFIIFINYPFETQYIIGKNIIN